MKKIQYIILTIFLFLSSLTFSQDDLKARVEFEEAEKHFNENNFSEAIQHLEKTEALLGKWTPKVSFMKIESLNKITDLNYLESENSKKLIKEVKLYMDFCNKQKDNVVIEKFKVVYAIDEIIKIETKYVQDFKAPEYQLGKKAYSEKNYTEALSSWKKAAEKGNMAAMRDIGNLYYDGNGVEKNETEAVNWYKKAADKGNDSAMNLLGISYYYGDGVIKNNIEALYWYKKSAERGNHLAMNSVGKMY